MALHVKDEQELHRKIAAVQAAGKDSLHVISDFDLTLSKSVIDGRKVPSLFGLVRGGDYLSTGYPEKAYGLYDRYRPLENDPSLELVERMEKMREWWSTHADIMVEHGMSREVLDRIVRDHSGILKGGAEEFFRSLERDEVPLLIFSSGLGDLIKGFLEKEDLLSQNVHVIANFFTFDDEGKATGYRGNIVHSYNKNEVRLKDKEFFPAINERRNVLLLGDSLGDPSMADGVEHDTIIKVGFLYDEDKLLAYLDAYDVVLVKDDTLTYVNDLYGQLTRS